MAKIAKKPESGSSSRPSVAATRRTPTAWEDMDRWFDDLASRGWLRSRFDWPAWAESRAGEGMRAPKVDVIERDNELVLTAELPGVEKKNLDVSMSDVSVTIKGSVSREKKEKQGDYFRCEISRGTFQRTLPLPCSVNVAKVQASFRDGVLQLVMPKAGDTKRKRIDVR